jgi:hypothetical protein
VAMTPFDDEAYNDTVVEQFYRAIGAAPGESTVSESAREQRSRAQETLSLQ